MKKVLLAYLCLFALTVSAQNTALRTPRQLFPGLFEAVQMQRIFPDNKTFVDAIPRETPAVILQAYNEQRQLPGFDLNRFVLAYFRLPTSAETAYHTNIERGLRAHLDTLWTVLQRPPTDSVAPYSSLLPLPRPYVVPGGRFREVYYWDSYFTMLGLQVSHRPALIRGMVDNFAFLINQYGFIPNGNRTYYLTRSQPPFFSRMVELLASEQGDTVLSRYHAPLLREYQFWMAGADSLAPGQAHRSVVRMPGGELLNRYWDQSAEPREESYQEDVLAAQRGSRPVAQFYRDVRAAAASGWDFSSRWFVPGAGLESIRTTSLVAVDLNSLLYELELTLARSSQIRGDAAAAKSFRAKAAARSKALQRYCWDKQAKWFVDYDWEQRKPSPVRTLAGVFPLESGLATPSQAKHVAQGLRRDFLQPGGLVTTLATTGQQWDAPNAWAPLQWMAIQGLRRYKQNELASTVAHRWISLNQRVFQQTGKLMEKYNAMQSNALGGGGEYPLQDGFGWTNGVLLNLLQEYPDAVR
ncbi:alpha,alpha-trehalase TreF [Hymenobacter taeanensis]|uniref:Alpha,alpha-trehalase TreF n=1 Tax=Hymenobacter taeanensis TaxID=2735321 RepID=A0A6M6BGI7_9BACT|nr:MULTISPECIES: alpha,alpha-trehalase TreF [Hymenobacter]QJX46978.1 alpha,alpha-trehalase TreF [Hymenobacter taeanensis]UOQ80854.1 alpha,alpha-trehalase TreF [Hymenobacter sp. 5414T-23]